MVVGDEGARTIVDYRDLDVWNEAMALAADIYGATRSFPKEELFGMTSQMRRSAVSIPSNIAEGFGREQTRSFIQFLRIAQGSLKELETQVLLCVRVGLMREVVADPLAGRCERIGKMLRALVRALEKKEHSR